MIVNRPDRIRATIEVPSDKSISHRALIFNAIADGRATIEGILDSEDVRSTAACLAALGVAIDWPKGASIATVQGNGLHGLFETENVLDCRNSGTTMRLLTGLLSAHPILSILTGDDQLRRRPMARIISPLRRMGAHIHARTGDTLAPLAIKGGDLKACSHDNAVASAQVKSAILLAGLYADGETTVTEPFRSRDHTERMLTAMGAALRSRGETKLSITPAQHLSALSLRVPGDISSAAPWLVLGACHPDAEILVRNVNTNPTRTGMLDILRAMGANIEVVEERTTGGEPAADIIVRSSTLHGIAIGGALVPRAIDELPLVAILGSFAEGETVVQNAEELIVKETDRVAATVQALGRLGAKVQARADGFSVSGPTTGFHGGRVDAGHDHRIGMLAGIAGCLADGDTRIDNDAVAVSYPRFWDDIAQAAEGTAARS